MSRPVRPGLSLQRKDTCSARNDNPAPVAPVMTACNNDPRRMTAAAAPESARQCRAVLEKRENAFEAIAAGSAARKQMDGRTIARLADVALLGGYAPEAAIAIGERYQAWFSDEKLVIFGRRGRTLLTEAPYGEIEDVEIGGPGVVRSGGGFVGGGFGAVGALEGWRWRAF